MVKAVAADGRRDHNRTVANRVTNMWVRLEDEEINQILRLIPAGSLADKLREKPHPDTSAFVGAVETDDELEVDPDAVISRGNDGAFVMSWS
ncbi:hypothetical protein [Rhizobium mongolense]|uniref:Uncharacterized protein n=2 Tax=Rhizobium mongolense TaxID=57676 RepID=A0ABR6IN88_9HYPH|nr:hypothetical protein [Rhizobium mongolense]MBB4229306.1 hypothetical protein [Rhizobium mongolense]